MGVFMKKLGVLIVTMLTAIFAFSFSAFAKDLVSADTSLHIKRDGTGTNSITYFFDKENYDFDHKCLAEDPTDLEMIQENFKNSELSKYLTFEVGETLDGEYKTFTFSFSFDNMAELNNSAFELVMNSVAQDVVAYSTLYDQDNKKILSISKYTFNAISYATSYFLFLDNSIAENNCKYTYSLILSDSLGVFTDLPIDKMEYNECLEYDLNSADAPKVTEAPAQNKPAATVKPATTTKPTAKPVAKKNVKKDNSPKTGDNSKLVILFSLMGVSLVLGGLSIKKLNKNRVN